MRATLQRPEPLQLDAELYRYVTEQTSLPVDDVLLDLVEETNSKLAEHAHMVVPAEEGSLLTFLVTLLAPAVVVEVGTFTGYSSLCIARGLDDSARLFTFDSSQSWTDVARRYWRRAGVDQRIELTLGAAADTLPASLHGLTVDLAFIDADKPGYIDYWEAIVPRVRPGGLVLADNTLFQGAVIDADAGPKARAIHAFNAHVLEDERVDSVLLPIGDGITFARVRDTSPGTT